MAALRFKENRGTCGYRAQLLLVRLTVYGLVRNYRVGVLKFQITDWVVKFKYTVMRADETGGRQRTGVCVFPKWPAPIYI